MKKTLLLALVFCMALSTAAFAGVSGGAHDLSDSVTLTGANASDQICVFCHHPHGTGSGALLWNINDVTTASFTMYSSPFSQSTTTASISTNATGTGGTAECMSCHDGNIATDALKTGGTLSAAYTLSAYANLGTNLTDDHPVGFNYSDVVNDANESELETEATAETNGVVFYGSGEMACASCHDVHDTTNSPFLRDTLTGSALCLDCHIK